MKVLVIDDEPGIRDIIAHFLRDAGHEVVEASDGRSGQDLFRAYQPDLVMTDIMMPGRDGIEIIRTLQAEKPGTRIIAISGGSFGNCDFLDMAGKLGATATLAKPFRRDELLALLRRLGF